MLKLVAERSLRGVNFRRQANIAPTHFIDAQSEPILLGIPLICKFRSLRALRKLR